MTEELKRVGALLKSKRKELHLSIKEVENSTSIRSGYLEAIEEGKVHEYLAGIYVVGFLKQYAAFLGFDVERLVREHPHAFRGQSERHDFSYGIGTLEMRGSAGGGIRWLPNLLWAAAAALVLLVAWFLARYLGVI